MSYDEIKSIYTGVPYYKSTAANSGSDIRTAEDRKGGLASCEVKARAVRRTQAKGRLTERDQVPRSPIVLGRPDWPRVSDAICATRR
jgi:hypothetical protein